MAHIVADSDIVEYCLLFSAYVPQLVGYQSISMPIYIYVCCFRSQSDAVMHGYGMVQYCPCTATQLTGRLCALSFTVRLTEFILKAV